MIANVIMQQTVASVIAIAIAGVGSISNLNYVVDVAPANGKTFAFTKGSMKTACISQED